MKGNRFTNQEVEDVIFQMHHLKSSGPDGLLALFYQKYWHFVGGDVQHHALVVLNNGKCPKELNKTYITLIPKCNSPTSTMDFRPISLCNVVMKIVTKTIANRLKQILPNIIYEEKNAFVNGRLICRYKEYVEKRGWLSIFSQVISQKCMLPLNQVQLKMCVR